jgi:hypothetical protein
LKRWFNSSLELEHQIKDTPHIRDFVFEQPTGEREDAVNNWFTDKTISHKFMKNLIVTAAHTLTNRWQARFSGMRKQAEGVPQEGEGSDDRNRELEQMANGIWAIDTSR